MLDGLLDGISNKIFKIFGEEHTIYFEKQEQGFMDNSFFIKVLDTKHIPMHFKSRETETTIEILYFPLSTDNEQKASCHRVFSKLSIALEEIELEDCIVFGTNITGKVVDNVLVCTVNYGYFILGDDTDEDLEEIEDLYFDL